MQPMTDLHFDLGCTSGSASSMSLQESVTASSCPRGSGKRASVGRGRPNHSLAQPPIDSETQDQTERCDGVDDDDDEDYISDSDFSDETSIGDDSPKPQKRSRTDPAAKATIERFWRSKGVTVKSQLAKLTSMASSRKLYGDLKRIELKLTQLHRMLPGADVVKIVSNAPNLLVYDIEASIPPKLKALHKLLPGVDIIKIVASSPHLLTFDIENNIGPKIRQLWQLLPGANVVKIVSAAPNLLSYDIETSLKQKLEQLYELLPGADVIKLISYAPTLLYHDTSTSIAPKLKQLQSLLPNCDVVKMVCAAPPLLCSDIEGSVARKLLWMREMVDGKPEEVDEKIESNPRLLTCGYGVVFGRVEFISKIRGNYVPVKDLRSILLAPVAKFEEEYPGYAQYLAQQLQQAKWSNKTVEQLLGMGVKKLESDYGNCLRAVVNKN